MTDGPGNSDATTVERRFLGVVDVDSGTLIVGDPTYVLADKRRDRAGADYQEVLDAPSSAAVPLGIRPVLLIQDFGGDGTFPVFGEFEDGEFMRLIVEFTELDLDDDADDGGSE